MAAAGEVKKPNGEAAPAVAAIGDDVLGDIFLHLPDTASLARAALACKRWRRVASDHVLLRRFHSLHSPPLLGAFLSDRGVVPGPCPKLQFVPVRSGNPHLDAAASTGDFFFKNIPEHNFDSDEKEGNGMRHDPWRLRCCDGGLLLLSRGRFPREHLAVYDPFARTAVFFRATGGFSWVLNYALLADEADADASFRVVAAQFFNDRVEAAVFSSRTRDWSPLPSHDGVCRAPWNAHDGVRAGRFAYWQSNSNKYYNDKERVLVLDTISMEWSLLQVPFPIGEPYCAADMAEYGGLCLVVGSKTSHLQLWVSIDAGWMMMKQVSLPKEFPWYRMNELRPLAVRGDYVFMECWGKRKPRHYLLLLNLKTMKLEMVQNNAREPCVGSTFPFFMSWAPPLLSPGI